MAETPDIEEKEDIGLPEGTQIDDPATRERRQAEEEIRETPAAP
jgi:hypothetical protein